MFIIHYLIRNKHFSLNWQKKILTEDDPAELLSLFAENNENKNKSTQAVPVLTIGQVFMFMFRSAAILKFQHTI